MNFPLHHLQAWHPLTMIFPCSPAHLFDAVWSFQLFRTANLHLQFVELTLIKTAYQPMFFWNLDWDTVENRWMWIYQYIKCWCTTKPGKLYGCATIDHLWLQWKRSYHHLKPHIDRSTQYGPKKEGLPVFSGQFDTVTEWNSEYATICHSPVRMHFTNILRSK